MLPEVYFTQISNLSEARFASSVMAKGIAFCFELDQPNYVPIADLHGFKQWLVGSEWIAALSKEPSLEMREIIDYFGIKKVLFKNTLYHYDALQTEVFNKTNFIKKLTPLKSKEDFNIAFKNKTPDVLLFGSKEEEVGMASMEKWLTYFEALEIL